MKQIKAYQASDGTLFKRLEDCEDYEYENSSYGEDLTSREAQVYKYLKFQHLTLKDIGAKLGIKPRTVKAHAKSVYSKLGVTNRIGLLYLEVNNAPKDL